MGQLQLDPLLIDRARQSAKTIAAAVHRQASSFTTTAIERATLRLLGVDGVDGQGIPLPNLVVDHLLAKNMLGRGVVWPVVRAVNSYNLSAQEVAVRVAGINLDLSALPQGNVSEEKMLAYDLAEQACATIRQRREERNNLLEKLGEGTTPYLYIIVATGSIYEDIKQAQAAARQGADIIAVIRSTGQSLLDYVPFDAATGGFGGTWATQENFRLMRRALDQVSAETGRYIRLTNYCSGLCMPEIAVMGALERLDMMLNDCMYGIIFRDINMQRTFIDQFFSRMVNAYAGIIINTGEDNYLTTADAYTQAHTVLSSQFINEQFALMSGLTAELIGLGHAFEINPEMEDGFLWELAQAQLVRQVFPEAPVKYMPPTKYMTGNIFQGHIQDALFNIVSLMTGQTIHLLGILTEAVHNPFLQDRYLSISNARYIFNNMRHLGEEVEFKTDGRLFQRASQVLSQAADMLDEIKSLGLMEAISRGMFADIPRSPGGGKGLDGVIAKSEDYYNPFPELMIGRAN